VRDLISFDILSEERAITRLGGALHGRLVSYRPLAQRVDLALKIELRGVSPLYADDVRKVNGNVSESKVLANSDRSGWRGG